MTGLTRRKPVLAVMGILGGHVQGATEGIESMEAADADLHELVKFSAQPRSEEERAQAHEAIESMRAGRDLSPAQEAATEAIILPELRPVVKVANNDFAPFTLPMWQHLNRDDAKQNILRAIPAVGRIEVPDHPSLPYAGTGFLVGEGLMMTNRHVAEIFAEGLGNRELRFRSGLENNLIDFRQEDGVAVSEPFTIRAVLMVHPFWDMALLAVEGLSASRKPLTLQSTPAAALLGEEVVVIGYPAQDSRNDFDVQQRVFAGAYRVKRLQPGLVKEPVRVKSFGHQVEAMAHDSSTLGGNSGSALVHVKTGQVVGLHFGGVYLDKNWAVPAFELSRDEQVVNAKVQFSKTNVGDVPWKQYWLPAAESGIVRPQPPAATKLGLGAIGISVPLTITLKLGEAAPVSLQVPLGEAKPSPANRPNAQTLLLQEARTAARAGERLPYYDAVADKTDRAKYYSGLKEDQDLFEQLHDLVERTHRNQPRYQPAKTLYPWVDRQKDGRIRSLYSAKGRSFTFEELMALDAEVLKAREERIAELESVTEAALEDIEATLPFNCEHTVPQSWFNKNEPMRGDLHHLFGCEVKCNSFRSNHAYFEFTEEKTMQDCGEMQPNQFEPAANKGAVARATFYFLVRYRGRLKTTNLPADRIRMLLKWHDQNPPNEWERHRNQAIFAVQGNRNPFIDLPGLTKKLDLRRGLAGPTNDSTAAAELPEFLESALQGE